MKKLLILSMLCISIHEAWGQANPTHDASGNLKTAVTKTIEDFGAVASDGLDDSKAFDSAARWFSNINNNNINYATSYGILNLDTGTYIVGDQIINNDSSIVYGQQKFETRFQNGIDGLIIQGKGQTKTKIQIKTGTYFGYFERSNSTALHNPHYGYLPPNFQTSDNNASIAEAGYIFRIDPGTKNILIQNMEMDGNSDHYVIGYASSSNGDFNASSYGILYYGKQFLSLKNINIHNFGMDGIFLEGENNTAAPYGRWNITIDSVCSKWNGRQALSWVQGRDVKIENSTFAYTRLKEGSKDIDPNPVMSPAAGSPGSNVDIETWSGSIRNGLFKNCKIIGNSSHSPSLYIQNNTDSVKFVNCEIKAFNNANTQLDGGWEAVGAPRAIYRNFTFESCDIIGSIFFYNFDVVNRANSGLTKFQNCSIKGNNFIDPDASNYYYYPIISTYDRVLFDNCSITRNTKRPIFHGYNITLNENAIPSPDNYVTLNNCSIYSAYERPWDEGVYDPDGRMYGLRFTGNTIFSHIFTSPSRPNYNFLEEVTINGSNMYSPMNTFTFSNYDAFRGAIYSSSEINNPSWDVHYPDRPIIIGETPCEYLNVYIGETNDGQSVIKNDGRPLYIGEGVTLTVRKGSALVLSGDIYLAGKIIAEAGSYFWPTGATIHYLSSTTIASHIQGPGAATPQQPPFNFWTPSYAPLSYVSHSLRSQLMAPEIYLKSTIHPTEYDNPNLKCQQCILQPPLGNNPAVIICSDPAPGTGPNNRPVNTIIKSSSYRDIVIYPNPTNDKVTISLSNQNEISEIQLLDINGKLLYKTTSKGEDVTLSLRNYAQGTYLIRISSASNTVMKKIVKSN